VKPLALSLAAVVLAVVLQAQTAPPSAGTPRPPWQPRPVIIVDPRDVLASPAPSRTLTPKHRATPHPRAAPTHRRAAATKPPQVFERYDTSPSPRP
jgi:hypothetical protein